MPLKIVGDFAIKRYELFNLQIFKLYNPSPSWKTKKIMCKNGILAMREVERFSTGKKYEYRYVNVWKTKTPKMTEILTVQ